MDEDSQATLDWFEWLRWRRSFNNFIALYQIFHKINIT